MSQVQRVVDVLSDQVAHVVVCERTGVAVVIDPAPSRIESLIAHLHARGVSLGYVLETSLPPLSERELRQGLPALVRDGAISLASIPTEWESRGIPRIGPVAAARYGQERVVLGGVEGQVGLEVWPGQAPRVVVGLPASGRCTGHAASLVVGDLVVDIVPLACQANAVGYLVADTYVGPSHRRRHPERVTSTPHAL